MVLGGSAGIVQHLLGDTSEVIQSWGAYSSVTVEDSVWLGTSMYCA